MIVLSDNYIDCCTCKHKDLNKLTGKAFPNEIPYEIYNGDITHFEPIEGDNGIQFEPLKDSELE